MIVARLKPLPALLAAVGDSSPVLVAGCQGCVAVCAAGGDKEVNVVADLLELDARRRGVERSTFRITVPRQCDCRFFDPLAAAMAAARVCVSLGCGVGVQYIADCYPDKPVIPGVDTLFAGGSQAAGVWEERCRLCGDCLLGETGGICPVTRCAKGLLNGPCGGAVNGRCEVDAAKPCAWQLIYERLKAQGRLAELEIIRPPKDWSAGAGAGPVVREDLVP
ncbi:MAG: methylenetetrahydrofolate reductase C-terminal domain-containing protein [Bacillota bacterium]